MDYYVAKVDKHPSAGCLPLAAPGDRVCFLFGLFAQTLNQGVELPLVVTVAN
jgi:hypothetical protein